jgi:hypothetical protein
MKAKLDPLHIEEMCDVDPRAVNSKEISSRCLAGRTAGGLAVAAAGWRAQGRPGARSSAASFGVQLKPIGRPPPADATLQERFLLGRATGGSAHEKRQTT